MGGPLEGGVTGFLCDDSSFFFLFVYICVYVLVGVCVTQMCELVYSVHVWYVCLCV